MICPHCKKENANEYAVTCAYCKNNMYPDANPEEKAKELRQAQQKDSVFSGLKGILSVILAIVVVVGVILMPKPSFDNNEHTPTQNNIETTTQKQQTQNVVTTQAPIVETTTQKPKMSYSQAIKFLADYVKKGQYDEEDNCYSRAIKQYDTSGTSSKAIMLLVLRYYPDTNTLSLARTYNTEDYSNVVTVRMEGYETTEMVIGYTEKNIITTKFVSGTSTKDTYRPGVNIPCTDYTYFGVSGGIEKHTAADERKASSDMTSAVADMLRNFDTFLKSSNAGFDLTTLGYKAFYGI